MPFICECATESCTVMVKLSLAEYEEVRTSPTRFFVAPGHQASEGALFREVNERLQELAEGFERADKLDLICECGNASCASRVAMDRQEYEHVRSDSATFAIAKGHEYPDVEEIVERRNAYDVVRKTAAAAEAVAQKTDPRA